MQIMSSPIMSDAADTPMSGSGGSPSPLSPASTSKHILDFSKKDFVESKTGTANGIGTTNIVEVPGSERSVSVSPAILVPTPRSTPPVNGILTPPNDTEGTVESSKQGRPGGRLKFFKDGVLCLELSHHGEGERTKWVQIRSKTVFPTLVHAVREATIPCHSTPSSFASPSSLTHTHRVESSTSHSLSDDACSMLSSPRTRENHWKQSVPQRGFSSCLQFYMKPAPCALKIRGKLKELYRSQEQIRKRWPYNCCETQVFAKLKNSVQCCCDELSPVLTDSSSISANVKKSNNSKDKISSDENENVETLRGDLVAPLMNNEPKSVHPKKTSLNQVIQHLEKVASTISQNRIAKEGKASKFHNDHNDSGKKAVSSKTSITPKKRLFNEVEAKESGNVRPKKKSPNRTPQEKGKTILNIPGLNSEFYKRHTTPVTTRSPVDVLDGRGGGAGQSSISDGHVNKRRTRSPHFGAKSTSPGSSLMGGSVLKPCLTGELVNRYSPLPGRNVNKTSNEHLSPRQEQQYLQQQTVSKAISYTINSLLGTGSIPGDAPTNSQAKRTEHPGHHKMAKDSLLCGHKSPPYQNQREGQHGNAAIRNANSHRPEQDQTSFLRHLLDTSDPIPPSKSSERGNKNISRSIPPHHNNNNGKNSVLKTPKERNFQIHENLAKSTCASPQNIMKGNSSSSSSSSPSLSSQKGVAHAIKDSLENQSIATNLALSSLMSSFPLGLTPPYDLLARGANANPHSTDALTAAAAAAAMQFGSLIPGFSPIGNSTMAAAAMAQYLGIMPMANFPMPATPPSTLHSPSPPAPPVKTNSRRSQETPPSNHRSPSGWQGTVNGHSSPISSPAFRNASAASPRNSQSSPVRTSSAISTVEIPSCGALNLSAKKKNRIDEPTDLDAPLDLCKKPSR